MIKSNHLLQSGNDIKQRQSNCRNSFRYAIRRRGSRNVTRYVTMVKSPNASRGSQMQFQFVALHSAYDSGSSCFPVISHICRVIKHTMVTRFVWTLTMVSPVASLLLRRIEEEAEKQQFIVLVVEKWMCMWNRWNV